MINVIDQKADFLASIYQNKIGLLGNCLDHFLATNLKPCIGLEWEFYLLKGGSKINNDDPIIEEFISKLNSKLDLAKLTIYEIIKEHGSGQIELKTLPSLKISKLCEDFCLIKKIVEETARSMFLEVNFDAQYFTDDCGSSLQINFSLTDQNNNFLFGKNFGQDNNLILWSIAGILEMAESITIFSAPQSKDYLRYNLAINQQLHKSKKYPAPTKISWGYDNRTTLIRIPATRKLEERRLEFRLPTSNADIYLVISTMLIAINYGIKNKIKPGGQLYGNAFEEQYDLQILPDSYETALRKFFSAKLIINELSKLIGNSNSPF